MPLTKVEMEFTENIETSYTGVMEVDVPQEVIDNDGVFDFIADKYDKDHEFATKVKAELDESDSSEYAEWSLVDVSEED